MFLQRRIVAKLRFERWQESPKLAYLAGMLNLEQAGRRGDGTAGKRSIPNFVETPCTSYRQAGEELPSLLIVGGD